MAGSIVAAHLFSATSLLAFGVTASRQVDPLAYPACKGVRLTLTVRGSPFTAGERPEFSLTLSNETNRPVRVLNVRNGRRADLQDAYFELFVTQRGNAVQIPVMISDPGPLTAEDFFDLRPRESADLPRISYRRVLDKLAPGRYEAFVLFWRDPLESSTTRCRSTAAPFEVRR